jgi:hypothetical protein
VTKERGTPYRSLTTLNYVLIAGAVLAVGVLCLYLGSEETRFWRTHRPLRTLMEQLGGLLIVSAGLSMLWELIGKRAFAREVLESTRMATELEASGIKRITNQFHEEAVWKECFKGVEKLDIFVAYAQTWRRIHFARLRSLAQKSNGRIRLYLADPEDTLTMTALAARFETDPDELKRRIWETKEEFEALRIEGGASIEVSFWSGYRFFTFYRFDNRAVVAFYQHSAGRSAVLPTIVCENGGFLFQFIYDELRSIRDTSRSATPGTDHPDNGEAHAK